MKQIQSLVYGVLLVGGAGVVLLSSCTPPSAPPPTAAPTLPVPTAAPTAAVATVTQPAATVPPPTVAPTATATIAPATATPARVQVAPPTELGTLAGRFEAALNEGDVEGAVALFEPGAEAKLPPDRYVGLVQIRDWISYLADNHFAIEPGQRRIVGDRATWPAEVRSDYLVRIGLPSLQGTASLVMHDGHIQSYQFVLTEDSAHRHRAAQLAASQVLQDPIIVGQDRANVYGFNDVFRDSTGQLVSYRDVLQADPGSGPFHDIGGEPVIIRTGF